MTTAQEPFSELLKTLLVRAAQGVAVSIAGWFVNHLSLAGVDFKSLGLDSEIIKQAIVGCVFLAITCPMEMFKLAGLGIYRLRVFFHTAMLYIVCGIEKPLPPDEPEKPNE